MRKIADVLLLWIPYLMLKDGFRSIHFVGEATGLILAQHNKDAKIFFIESKVLFSLK